MRETIANNAQLVLALAGLLIGFSFGAIVYRTNYCAMGSLSDIHNFGDYRRFRAWVLAAATALVGAQFLQWTGVVALDKSMYLTPSLNWIGNVVGGAVFGVGMVLAGGCPSRNLARAGGGDLRALLTLIVLGIFAYMTIAGLVAPVRAAIDGATSFRVPGAQAQGLNDVLAAATGGSRITLGLILGLFIAAAAASYCFMDVKFRSSPMHVISGAGLMYVSEIGWTGRAAISS